MNALILSAAILLQAVNADFNGDLSKASSLANSLSGQVASWSSGDGLQGALGIQNGFPPFSQAIGALSGDAGSLKDSDLDTGSVSSFAGAVGGLLDALTQKASDFKAVSAQSIVSNDIQSLGSPAADILKNIINAASGDCPKISSLSSAFDAVVGGFSSADAAYGLSNPDFPSFPSCNGGSGSSGSSSAASSAETSSAASSAASSAPASSSAGSSVAVQSSAATGSSSGVAVSNGAAKAAVGLSAAAAAGAIAMLI